MQNSPLCKKCQRPQSEYVRPDNGKRAWRCRACEYARGKARRGIPDPDKTPPIFSQETKAPPPPPDLEQIRQEFVERSRISEAERRNKLLLKENAELLGKIESLRFIQQTSDRVVIDQIEKARCEIVPLIQISDLHLEETVDFEKMHGLNEFNLAIAQQRMETCARNAGWLIEREMRDSKVTQVVVALEGDCFSNNLRMEAAEINALGPVPAACFSKDRLRDMLAYLAEKFPEIQFNVYCVSGNHGRMTEKTRIATNAENSLETFMYHFLASEMQPWPNVRFEIASGFMLYAKVFPNYTIRFIHGDQVKFKGGIGGLTIPMTKWIHRQNQGIFAQLTMFGHFHQRMNDSMMLGNGSMIGATSYSSWLGFSKELPQMQFAVVHEREGGTLAGVHPIWCT